MKPGYRRRLTAQGRVIPVSAFTRIEPYPSPDGQTKIDTLAENGILISNAEDLAALAKLVK